MWQHRGMGWLKRCCMCHLSFSVMTSLLKGKLLTHPAHAILCIIVLDQGILFLLRAFCAISSQAASAHTLKHACQPLQNCCLAMLWARHRSISSLCRQTSQPASQEKQGGVLWLLCLLAAAHAHSQSLQIILTMLPSSC